MLSRPATRKEVRDNPKASAALLIEWDRLRQIPAWDEKRVREWSDVAREAKEKNITVHVGRVFDITVEKHAELPNDHPERKFKVRVVFQGNNVKDQDREYAIFEELNSCPATMTGARTLDAFSLLPGCTVEQADADQAYTQSRKKFLSDTWVRLPREQWPKSWENMRPCMSLDCPPVWSP